MIRILTKQDIIELNKATIKAHGGQFIVPFNVLNENSLDYLIEIVDKEIFGQFLYPEIWDKAGIYMFNVISNHIFSDGNKRTGLAAALYFLRINGFVIKDNLQNNDLFDFTIHVASGGSTLEEVQGWFKEHTVRISANKL